MTFLRTESFRRDFQALSPEIQEQVEKALRRMGTDLRHRSLRVKKMQPKARGIFEARVTRSFRMTFTLEGDVVLLRRVGTHDILKTP